MTEKDESERKGRQRHAPLRHQTRQRHQKCRLQFFDHFQSHLAVPFFPSVAAPPVETSLKMYFLQANDIKKRKEKKYIWVKKGTVLQKKRRD